MAVLIFDGRGKALGNASDLILTTSNLQMKNRPLRFDKSGRVMQSPPDGVLNPEVHLEGLALLTQLSPETAQVRELRTVIATLVHMMGGSVTIQPSELMRANERSLVQSQFRDPWYLQLTTED